MVINQIHVPEDSPKTKSYHDQGVNDCPWGGGEVENEELQHIDEKV